MFIQRLLFREKYARGEMICYLGFVMKYFSTKRQGGGGERRQNLDTFASVW